MKTSTVDQNDNNTTKGARPYPNILDLAFEFEKRKLEVSGFPQRAITHLDRYSRFRRIDPKLLSSSHRWTKEDTGRTFVGYEMPEKPMEGLVFEVVVTAVFSSSVICFEVSEAYDLTRIADDGWSVWHLGPFSSRSYFEIDAEKPMTLDFADRACAMLDSDEAHDRFRLFMAIQNWALQPMLG
jgi:hypothetical protein